MIIELDMYQTLAIAVVVLMLGKFLRKKCSLLEKFCIPAPVVGGVLFAVFTCVCYVTGIVEFTFDDILKEVCMVFFFTSVGFQANLKVLKSGGKSMLVFLSLVIALILAQNFLAVGKHQTAVVLLHDAANKNTTVEALPAIIEEIQAMDDTVLLPVSDDMEFVQHLKLQQSTAQQ